MITEKRYEVKMGEGLRFSTRLIWALSLLPAAAGLYYAREKFLLQVQCPESVGIIPWLVLPLFFLVPAILVFYRFLAPEGYLINYIELIIERRSRPIAIPLMAITEARLLTDEDLKWTFKLTGAQGFYGYYGLFWSWKLGKFQMQGTRMKNLVGVRTAKTLYALSPEDPEEFLTTLRNLIPR